MKLNALSLFLKKNTSRQKIAWWKLSQERKRFKRNRHKNCETKMRRERKRKAVREHILTLGTSAKVRELLMQIAKPRAFEKLINSAKVRPPSFLPSSTWLASFHSKRYKVLDQPFFSLFPDFQGIWVHEEDRKRVSFPYKKNPPRVFQGLSRSLFINDSTPSRRRRRESQKGKHKIIIRVSFSDLGLRGKALVHWNEMIT